MGVDPSFCPHYQWEAMHPFAATFFTNIRTDIFGIPIQTKDQQLSGIFQAFADRLRPQRPPGLWTEQLLESWPLQCEAVMVGLPGPHPVSQSSKSPFDIYAAFPLCSFGGPRIIQNLKEQVDSEHCWETEGVHRGVGPWLERREVSTGDRGNPRPLV